MESQAPLDGPLGIVGYSARPLTSADDDALQALCERCEEHFVQLTGLPPGPDEAQSLFFALPEGKGYDDKMLTGVFDATDTLVGVLDVIRHYPDGDTWHIGLLLLDPAHRRRGVGTAVYRALEALAVAAGARRVRLGVASHNLAAFYFWQRLGFVGVERRPPQEWGRRTVLITVMQKPLP